MIKKLYASTNATKLHAELLDAKVDVILVEQLDEGAQITFADDVDITLVQSLVDAHDATPIVSAPSQDDFLLDLELRMTALELGLTL